MYSEEFYAAYFEGLATSLTDLNHSSAKAHFFMNNETGNGLSELKTAIGGKLNLPCLVLDEEELDGDGSSSGQKMSILGGFAILDKFDPGDIKTLAASRNRAKTITRKIVNKMKRDCRASFDEESPLLLANAIQLGEIRQYPTPIILNTLIGWAVEFKWILPEDIRFGAQDFN